MTVVDLGDGEVVEVLSAVAEVAGDECDRWVRVDEVIDVLLSRPSPSGRMWARGLDPWHGLKRHFEREHGADWIVTGDNDLLEWEDETPPAITPAAFEALLGDPPDS